MANQIKIKAEPRVAQGSGAARRLRRSGFVPAALNRIGGATVPLQLDAHAFGLTLHHLVSEHVLVTIELGDENVAAMLREVQHDVLDGHAIHADFGEVDMTRKLRTSIPLKLVGEPEGVRTEGGVMTQALREVVVECLPADIVESFSIDVSALKLGEALAAGSLKLGDKYELVTHADVVVATVVAVAAEEVTEAAATEGAAAAAPGAAGAQPEVIAKGKKEEEGAEAEKASPKKK